MAATALSRTRAPRPVSKGSLSKSPSISTPSAMLFQLGEWTPDTVRGVKTQICLSSTNRCGPALHLFWSR
ncbi:hypothetical protein D3C87_1968240 [compost metagenome]